MQTRPITPAHIRFGSHSTQAPSAPAFGSHCPASATAAARAHHIHLAGNQLPTRWQRRHSFTVLELGFGLGHNFLATWHAWQQDPLRCEHLHFVAIEAHPPRLQDLKRAHRHSAQPALARALMDVWPVLTPNLHGLEFDNSRVTLLLAWGDVATLLPALQLQADAFYLDGVDPDRNFWEWPLQVLKALGRKAAPGATLASSTADPDVVAGLATAGFQTRPVPGFGGTGPALHAHHQARRTHTSPPAAPPTPRTAVVVGAGLAGAAVARALARQGLQVTVLESHSQPASQASGNVAGLFHGTVHGHDGVHARLHRAGALFAQHTYRHAIAAGVPGQQAGLLRLEQNPAGLAWMQALVARQRWPADYVQALTAAEASTLAGVPLASPAWHYPGGGWISPPQWVQAALATSGIRLQLNCPVHAVQRRGAQWQVLNTQGQPLAEADVLVLACAASAGPLLQQLGHPAWTLRSTRGQVTGLPCPRGLRLLRPVAGEGYALHLGADETGGSATAGNGLLWCGASSAAGAPVADELPPVTEADHQHNLQRLQGLLAATHQTPPATPLLGRAAWRLNTDNRLPIAGQMPLVHWPAGQRSDHARLLPREAGLFVLTALGARGLSLAPLLAQLVAAQATGAPWPLEQDLADAVDPARWRVRLARRPVEVPDLPDL